MPHGSDVERRLREGGEHLRLAVEAAGVGTFEIDVAARKVAFSPELSVMLGVPDVRAATLESAFARVHRDDVEQVRRMFETALQPDGDRCVRAEFRFVRPGGEVRWMTWTGEVRFRGKNGARKVSRVVGACYDVTQRRKAEEGLKDREAFLRDVIDSVPQHVCVLDMRGVIQTVNKPWLRFAVTNGANPERIGAGVDYLGVCRRAIAGGDETARAPLDGLEELIGGSRSSFFCEYPCHSPQEQRWFAFYASRLSSARGIIVSHLDISARRKAEEQVRLVMREFNHRIKNMLTLVDSIARQTAATSPSDYAEKFSERIAALAASHDMLISEEGTGISLEELIRNQLAHFSDLMTERRIVLRGPPLRVGAAAAQTIGMVLHELATNASKYGALSSETGKVEIAWEVFTGAGGGAREFHLGWSESGGPPIEHAPAHEGFGYRVVKLMPEASLDAKVELAFPEAGCRWRLRCPVARLEAI